MNKRDLLKARKILKKLAKEYDGFINVVFDNWRGFRFVFDTEDVRKCNNDCKNCLLYKLLKKENINEKSFGLFSATKNDKKIFGQQNFINCKTVKQYENCFVNFVSENVKTKKQFNEEIFLIKNFRILFTRNIKGSQFVEKKLKKNILKKVLS